MGFGEIAFERVMVDFWQVYLFRVSGAFNACYKLLVDKPEIKSSFWLSLGKRFRTNYSFPVLSCATDPLFCLEFVKIVGI